jgi:antirestriction protein ArdC
MHTLNNTFPSKATLKHTDAKLDNLLNSNFEMHYRYIDDISEEDQNFNAKIRKKANLQNIPSCQDLIAKLGNIPSLVPVVNISFYERAADRIFMPPPKKFVSLEMYYATLFHEIVHSTGHASRLNRQQLVGWRIHDDKYYCEEELIAEHGAAYLCAAAGIDEQTLTYHASYIQFYLCLSSPTNPSLPLVRARARDAVAYLLRSPQPISCR